MRSKGWAALGLLFSLFWGPRVVAAQHPNQEPVVPFGEYSDMKIDGEHCSGHSLQIWKSGDKLYGLLLVCEGLAGDTPTGLLEQINWNQDTGQLSFTSRLSIGSDVLENGKQVPSKDEFHFEGTLKADSVEGTLQSVDKSIPGADSASVTVHLNKRKSDMKRFENYRRWKTATDRVLLLRGPKW